MRVWMTSVLQHWAARCYVERVQKLDQEVSDIQAALTAEREKTRLLAEVQRENAEHVKRIKELEQQLEEANSALKVAGSENRLLSEIHEEDVSRRRRQRAIYDRDRAIATAVTRPGEESEG